MGCAPAAFCPLPQFPPPHRLLLCYMAGESPPTRPASVPGSPPNSSRGKPMSLRSARSADSSSLHQALRPRSPSGSTIADQHEAAGGAGKENEPQSHALQQLVAMGFPEAAAAEALRAAGGDAATAVALLSGVD